MTMTIRYQYFQTESNVTVEIYSPDAKIEIGPFKIIISQDDVTQQIELAYEVNPSQSKIEKGKKKQSIELKKVENELWPSLERKETQPEHLHAPHPEPKHEYLGKSYHKWDKLNTEDENIEKEKEGADPNDFFKTLYKDAGPEAQKAMMKSYQESGGTVLSTNWDEVKAKKVEVKPPEGMIPKTYEQ
eukprot:NODE_23_length_38171_cov_0.318108.p17 type:complete len:187 gc:universal NODE_23_length_38171_cov_0.318108:12421-11861(-)